MVDVEELFGVVVGAVVAGAVVVGRAVVPGDTVAEVAEGEVGGAEAAEQALEIRQTRTKPTMRCIGTACHLVRVVPSYPPMASPAESTRYHTPPTP